MLTEGFPFHQFNFTKHEPILKMQVHLHQNHTSYVMFDDQWGYKFMQKAHYLFEHLSQQRHCQRVDLWCVIEIGLERIET